MIGKAATAAMLAGVLFTAAASAQTSAQAQARPTAMTQSGLVEGVSTPEGPVFKGLPYAAAPVGALRWRPPAPAPVWGTPRDASAFGAPCPQLPIPKAVLVRLGGSGEPSSEDCLTLNVWAPAHARAAPVMVWFHGGANRFGTGASPFFDGAPFTRDGVVLVTLNYRLGPLGWFAHPALTREAAPDAPLASYGLMDQIAALAWVKRNIAAFGGDPSRITIFGESAGGQAVLSMLTLPAARGLFAQAIVESGLGWNVGDPLAAREQKGLAAAKAAGLPADATADQLRALPLSALNGRAFQAAAGDTVDGRLVTSSVGQAIARGELAPVPLLIGSNSGEESLMAALRIRPADLISKIPPDAKASAEAIYRPSDDGQLARALYRDGVMGAPARWIAAHAAARAPAFLYYLDYATASERHRHIGAEHGADVLYVFSSLQASPADTGGVSPRDRAEEDLIHGCWIAFAKTGRPTCPSGPAWPAYRPDGGATYVFGDEATVQSDFHKAAYDWQETSGFPATAQGIAPSAIGLGQR